MLDAGTMLGPYQVLSRVGAGGMGEVYRATDTRLNRDVAIKVLPASFANNEDRLSRFEQEALEKNPEQRFQSTSDLGFALEAVSAPTGPRIATEVALGGVVERLGTSRLFVNVWLVRIVGATLILGMLGFAWTYFTRQPPPEARVMKFSILPPENTYFDNLVVSPDGRWLAFTAAMGGKVQLWVRALDTTEAKPLPATEGATLPFWSPDSRWIGFFAIGKLKKIEASGGHTETICDAGVGTGGAWSRDGVILFSALGGAGLSRVSSLGGEVTSVMRTDWARAETNYTNPCFLPDGHHFVFSIFSGQKESRGIYLGSLDGGVKQRLLGDDSNAVYASSSENKI